MSSQNPPFMAALERMFEDGTSLVFWNDPDAEFSSQVDALEIKGVGIIRLDRMAAFQAKIAIERDESVRRLIYTPSHEPEPSKDWLLDARLRGKAFNADTASMQLEELGLTTQALRDHLKHRAKFLRAKDRLERLKRMVHPHDGVLDLDRKMIASIIRSDTADASSIFLKVFGGLAADGLDLGSGSKALDEIASFELEDAFWALAEREFGYAEDSAEEPNLRGLLFRIFTTDFCNGIGQRLAPIVHFAIEDKAKSAHASVFASRWRSDMANYASYDKLSNLVAEELHILDLLGPMSADDLVDAMTFEAIEKRVIGDLKARIIAGGGANMDSVRALMARRKDGHWANPMLALGNDSTRALVASYAALEAAASFFELQAAHSKGFSFANANSAFETYARELFKFDQLYRAFMRAAEAVEPMGWSLLHELRERMEEAYSGWFIGQLSSAWGSILEGGGLLDTWKLEGVVNQCDFFAQRVTPAFDGGAKRVYVVISDAFRFEAAEELTSRINSKSRMRAKLEPMLGVLPSYTALGMASLLPHKSLAYKSNENLDVTTDGQGTATLEQRSAILAAEGGVAIGRDELMEKGKDKGREFVKPYRLVYVYHDRIDAIGDKRGTETKTFEATAQAIDELADLVSFIVNNLNGATVLVTADHGFLYQESAMEEADRTILPEDPPGVVKPKKRYVLGRGMGSTPKAWCGNTELTAKTAPGQGSVDFWVPKGAGRFHFVGGARFVHGSAMPQEIVVPLITVKESDSEKAKTKAVEISLLGSSNKVVTNKQRFEFIQNEAVSERVLAVTLLFTIRDGDKPISDEQALTFDSSSPMLDERKRSTMLTIQSGSYDRTKDYFLVARDAKTKAEAWRSTLRIDLAFSNDF